METPVFPKEIFLKIAQHDLLVTLKLLRAGFISTLDLQFVVDEDWFPFTPSLDRMHNTHLSLWYLSAHCADMLNDYIKTTPHAITRSFYSLSPEHCLKHQPWINSYLYIAFKMKLIPLMIQDTVHREWGTQYTERKLRSLNGVACKEIQCGNESAARAVLHAFYITHGIATSENHHVPCYFKQYQRLGFKNSIRAYVSWDDHRLAERAHRNYLINSTWRHDYLKLING